MPKSKTRSTRPFRDRPAPVSSPEKALEVATLALVQASLEIVREAEAKITLAARTGIPEAVDAALENHLHLRAASLGLLVAYSRLAGLPDPRESEVVNPIR
jgi:hypothetical protein